MNEQSTGRAIHKVTQGWAALDLLITGVLTIPLTAAMFVNTLYWANSAMGSSAATPEFNALHWLFVCLAGSLGVLWAGVRLIQPSAFNSKADIAARAWITILLLYFILQRGAPVALFAFVATEILGAAHQLYALQRRRP